MKAIEFKTHGSADVLRYVDVEKPRPGPGEALVEVRAASINHLDIFVRRGIPGLKLNLPHRPGSDAAGVVAEVGEGVREVRVGDEVVINPGLGCGHCEFCFSGEPSLCAHFQIMGEHFTGAYAQFVKMPVANLVPKPDALSFTDAAALPLTLLTAWRMMISRGRIAPGEDVLVLGAGSGVGVLAVQLARMSGARVFVTASTPEKQEKAKALGADFVLDPAHGPVEKQIRALTSRRGVDVVVDYIGRDTWISSLKCLRNGGRLLTCGATSGHDPIEDLRHIFYRQLTIIGSTMGSRHDLEAGLKAVARGYVRPIVHAILPLSDAADGQLLLEGRKAFGKVILVP